MKEQGGVTIEDVVSGRRTGEFGTDPRGRAVDAA